MEFQQFRVSLTRSAPIYYDSLALEGSIGTVVDIIGPDPEKPEGYFVEVASLWSGKETLEIIELPVDGVKKIEMKAVIAELV